MAVSAQRRRRVLVAVVAALIAAGAFYLAIEYTNKATPATTTSGTGGAPTPVPVTTATVVEASAAIPAGTLLTATNLKTAAVSTDVLSVLTAAGGSDYPTIAALTAAREYAATPILAGLPILSSEVTSTPNAASAPVAGLSAVLPTGYVAFALPYSPGASSGNGMGTGGFIQSGDRIDILINNGAGTTTWAYQDVLVLALGQSSGAPVASSSASPAASSGAAAAAAPALVMVELSRQDAAAMAAVEDETSPPWTIQYLVVSSKDYPSASASPVPAIGAGPGNVTAPNSFFTG